MRLIKQKALTELISTDTQAAELTELQQRVAYLDALRQDESKKYSNQPNCTASSLWLILIS